MKEEFEKKLKNKRNILKGIGILEITGGVSGIGIILWLMLQGIETNTYVFLIFLFAIGFYIYSILAGIKLFKHLEKGDFHSRILQYIQIPGISLLGMTYILTSGGYLFVGYNLTEGSIKFDFGLIASKFQINILNSDQGEFIYLNIMAIIVLVLLEKSISVIREQKLVQENYERNMAEYKNSDEKAESQKSQLPTIPIANRA
ncbi:hypothetical protein [Maribacter sp. LLG6340-A2]|uniref:hypothetical protein n=1 Tax=Maribacter sp. LLG6340-A2 TaxID=3160834 RepID=UPI00386DECA6